MYVLFTSSGCLKMGKKLIYLLYSMPKIVFHGIFTVFVGKNGRSHIVCSTVCPVHMLTTVF